MPSGSSAVVPFALSACPQSVFKTMPVPYDIAQILYNENASVRVASLWHQCEETLKSLNDYDRYCVLTNHIRPNNDYKFPLVQKAGRPRKCCTSMLSNIMSIAHHQKAYSVYHAPYLYKLI